MLFRLVRWTKKVDGFGDVAVVGTIETALLDVPGTYSCFTLEREAVIIPADIYPVELTLSNRASLGQLWTPFNDISNAMYQYSAFRNYLPQLTVDGREGIRIHALNEARQSEGCIGVGRTHTETTIAQARDALTVVCQLLVDAQKRTETSTVQIVERFGQTPTWALP